MLDNRKRLQMATFFTSVLILHTIIKKGLTLTSSNLELIAAIICYEVWPKIGGYDSRAEFNEEDLFEFIFERIDSIAREIGLIKDQ